MGWIISKALYEKWHCSQEQEEEYSEDTCSDGKQSALSNGNPTQLVYLSPDKMTAFSRLSRFGMMCKPLTESRGEDLLMWYREDFLAKTYPRLVREKALPEREAVCGRTWHELSEKYDLNSCSWKIHHSLFPVELDWSSVTLPKWGMTVSGQLYQHQTSERPISGTGSGYWLTPTTMNIAPTEERREKRTAYRASVGRKDSPGSLAEQVATPKFWPTPRSCSAMSAKITPESAWNQDRFPNLETMVGRKTWPTPAARDWKGITITDNYPDGFNKNLCNYVAKWPTPTCQDANKATKKWRENNQNNLTAAVFNPDRITQVTNWPTPCATDCKGSGKNGKLRDRLDYAVERGATKRNEYIQEKDLEVGGHLNPTWVEWLMGWPLGWTDLRPLETDKFHAWLEQHSIS